MSRSKGIIGSIVIVGAAAMAIVVGLTLFTYLHADKIFDITKTTYISTEVDDIGSGFIVLMGSNLADDTTIKKLGYWDEIPPEVTEFIDKIRGETYELTVSRGDETIKHGEKTEIVCQTIFMDIPLPGAQDDRLKGQVRLDQC